MDYEDEGTAMSWEAWGDDDDQNYDHLIEAGWWWSERLTLDVDRSSLCFANGHLRRRERKRCQHTLPRSYTPHEFDLPG